MLTIKITIILILFIIPNFNIIAQNYDSTECSRCINISLENWVPLRSHIYSMSCDFDKLIFAKKMVRKYCLTSHHIGITISLFSFEGSKLELAEYAFRYVADRNQYNILFSYFKEDNSIEKLKKHIGNY